MNDVTKKLVSPEELMPEYIELIEAGAVLPLVISGGSMLPFLAPGRDTVFIKSIDRPLQVGDIVFFRRNNGRYVLHRLYKTEGESIWLVGDAQDEIEGPLNKDCAFAVVSHAVRKGKTEKPGTFWWDFFSKTWLKLLGHRKNIVKNYSKLKRFSGDTAING